MYRHSLILLFFNFCSINYSGILTINTMTPLNGMYSIGILYVLMFHHTLMFFHLHCQCSTCLPYVRFVTVSTGNLVDDSFICILMFAFHVGEYCSLGCQMSEHYFHSFTHTDSTHTDSCLDTHSYKMLLLDVFLIFQLSCVQIPCALFIRHCKTPCFILG